MRIVLDMVHSKNKLGVDTAKVGLTLRDYVMCIFHLWSLLVCNFILFLAYVMYAMNFLCIISLKLSFFLVYVIYEMYVYVSLWGEFYVMNVLSLLLNELVILTLPIISI